ncbi:hypothetical protein [Kitasatospora sp. NPDC101183]|uniref:hypothetical protein n=1 Tax=Kitasatospora sp. NPDC101183 TaxID=3364100 RepID=UPI00380DE2AC
MLVLAACSGGTGEGASAEASSSAAFGSALKEALDPINQGLAKAVEAKTPNELWTALGTVGSFAGRANRTLKAVSAPSRAEPARTELVNALDVLFTEAGTLGADLSDKKVCTVGTGQGRLGAGKGLPGVSAAVAKLTAGGFPAVFTVPKLPELPPQSRALENGTVVREGAKDGKSTLELTNNGSVDTLFILAQNKASVTSVYAAKGQKIVIDGIRDGVYDLYYAYGVDWDSGAKQFTQDCAFARLREKYDFDAAGGGTVWTVDIKPEKAKGTTKAEAETIYTTPQP